MLKLLKKIFCTGVSTEAIDQNDQAAIEFEKIGAACRRLINKYFSGSLAIRMVDAGSCNACELEMHALNNVFYNSERFGIHFVASPRHADVLLVSGPVSRNMEAALKTTYEAMPYPKLVIAMGDCAACGGEFGESYASSGKVANIIPVNAIIAGCPPTPLIILKAILQILKVKKL